MASVSVVQGNKMPFFRRCTLEKRTHDPQYIEQVLISDVFRTQANIYDEAFFRK